MAEIIISVICSVVSVGVAIVIAIAQFNQGKRMEKLAQRQDQEDKKQREQYIKAQRNAFIIKYHNDNDEIYLLPLCWVSSIYDPTFSYHRKMYMEFNMLEQDVQDAICKYMKFSVVKPIVEREEFYSQCVDALIKKEEDYSVEHKTLFYDNAKYLERCLTEYKKDLPLSLYDLENRITDLLCEFQKHPLECPDPIDRFAEEFNFSNADENIACEICAIAAKWIAVWDNRNKCKENYWIPGEHGYEELSTLEDLFLCAIFCIYVNLMVNTNDDSDEKK